MSYGQLAYYVFDIRSEMRQTNETVQRFRFPLSQAGIRTPADASVSMRARNGFVPLQEATEEALNKRFKVYLENMPVHSGDVVVSDNGDSRIAVAHGDYRIDESVYAKFYGDSQPTVQLLPNVMLPDVTVTLLDEDGEPFFPGQDWTLTLELIADQSLSSKRLT